MRKIIIWILITGILGLLSLGQTQYPASFLLAESGELPGMDDALALFYNKEPDISLDKYRQLSDLNPDNLSMRLNFIQLLNQTGKYGTSAALLRPLAAQNPQIVQYRSTLIQITYLAGQWNETIRLSDNIPDLTAAELFWRGLAFMDLNRDQDAIRALSDSLIKDDFNPMAYFKLGILYQKNADFEKAYDFYKKAAAQEPNMAMVYFPLAQVCLALKRYQTAYSLLLNAKAAYPWNQEIIVTLKKFIGEHPEILQQLQAEVQKRRKITTAPQVAPIDSDRDKIPVIRIGLAERVRKLYFKTGGKCWLKSGAQNYQVEAQSSFSVITDGKCLEIRDEQDKPVIRGEGSIFLEYDDPAATTVLFDVQYKSGSYWNGREDRVYRGGFQFLLKQKMITIVNRLNIEEYLYGVVPAEMQPAWPQAALEAQAIAARTYAITNLKSYEARGFDLLATVASQVYRGVNVEKPSTNSAVDATRGQILEYHEKPINAFYTANNGGYSTSSRDIWGFEVPYLQAVPDKSLIRSGPLSPNELFEWLTTRPQTYSSHPQYSARSSFRWTAWVSREEIENRLKAGSKLGRVLSVEVSSRSINGAVTKVFIQGSNGNYTVTGDKIRSNFGGLRSNMFIVMPKTDVDGQPDYFIFYGGGWGHGVGMCQSGAAGMAADGYSSDEILTHYYQGTQLVKLY